MYKGTEPKQNYHSESVSRGLIGSGIRSQCFEWLYWLYFPHVDNTVQTLYKGLEGTGKCCFLYQVDLISGVFKISLSCTKISESVILVIVIKTILYYIKL